MDSPYLGPDPESPLMNPCTPHSPHTYVVTPTKAGGRKRVSMIAGYKLGRTLGKGSCGVVKLGTHLQTGQKVAVKVLKPKNDRERSEIQREITALQQLNHPNIINLLGVVYGSDLHPSRHSADTYDADGADKVSGLDKYIFMILELASGGELFEKVLNGGALHEGEARRCFRQILSALSNTHAHLICHRDLKPENILFDADGNVKISDFGLSNIVQPGKLFGTWCGSPMYAPPEVVMEQRYKGWAVDVWSLGIILYIMITGGMPWRLERGQVRDMELFLGGMYQVPDDMGISSEAKDLLDRMIQSSPFNRACLRELCSHPWVTANGTLPPPSTYLELPANAQEVLHPISPANVKHVQYNVDEEVLFQVQEAIGLDRRGMAEARASIRDLRPCPALTAYAKIAVRKRTPTLLVKEEQLPVYMRHRRNRSDIPRPTQNMLSMATPGSLANPLPLPPDPFANPSVRPHPEEHGEAELVEPAATPFSPRPAARGRASTAPSAYKKVAAHSSAMSAPLPAPSTICANGDTISIEGPSEDFTRSRRETKQSASRHILRTLVLKLKWGKK